MVNSGTVIPFLLGALSVSILAAPTGESNDFDLEGHKLLPRQGLPPADIVIHSNCGKPGDANSMYDDIEEAVLEAKELAEPLYDEWIKQGKHQQTATRYFGLRQQDETPLTGYYENFIGSLFAKVGKVKDPVSRAPSNPVTSLSTITISCKDVYGECAKEGKSNGGQQPFGVARSKNPEGKDESFVTICKDIFEGTFFLDEHPWADRPQNEATIKNLINSRGGGILHEFMHLDYFSGGGKNHIKDQLSPISASRKLYGPQAIFTAAKEMGNTDVLALNADTYKMFAIEVYYQNKRGFRPYIDVSLMPESTCASDEGATDAVHRDTASKAIADACSDFADHYTSGDNQINNGNWYKEFNKGELGYMKFEIGWEKWARMNRENAENGCKSRMAMIVDGCDTNTDEKKGGKQNYLKVMGAEYSISMKDENPPAEPTLSCRSDNPDGDMPGYARVDKIDDELEDACADFTNQYFSNGNNLKSGYWAKTYNEGTPIAFEVSVGWKASAAINHVDAKKICHKHFETVLQQCDHNDAFKYGGHLDALDAEGTEWRIKLLTDRPDLDTIGDAKCDVWYHGGSNTFNAKGVGFASSDYGQDKILPYLRTCGIVKDWKFKYELFEEDGVWYEWKLSGWTYIGARWWGCLHSALVDAGATDGFKCGGH